MVVNDLFFDKRLQEKSIGDGKVERAEIVVLFENLKDSSANLMEFDEEGNPTNEVERVLKTLEMKTAEPEIYVAYEPELDELLNEDISGA